MGVIPSFYKEGVWDSEQFSNSPEVTQPVSGQEIAAVNTVRPQCLLPDARLLPSVLPDNTVDGK